MNALLLPAFTFPFCLSPYCICHLPALKMSAHDSCSGAASDKQRYREMTCPLLISADARFALANARRDTCQTRAEQKDGGGFRDRAGGARSQSGDSELIVS